MSWVDNIATRLVNTNHLASLNELEISKSLVEYLDKYEPELNSDPYEVLKSIIELIGPTIIEREEIRKILMRSLKPKEINELYNLIYQNNNHNDINLKIKELTLIKWKWQDSIIEKITDYFSSRDIIEDYNNLNLDDYEVPKRKIITKNEQIKGFYELHAFQYQLRDEIIDRYCKYLDQKVLLQLPTGAGKTRTAIHTIIQYLKISGNKGNILWLTYSPLLVQQAEDVLANVWPVLGESDLYVRHDLSEYLNDFSVNQTMILFSTIQTLHNKLPKNKVDLEKLSKSFSIIIFDEAHQLTANLAKEIISKLLINNQKIKVLGLTATPGRGSGIPKEIMTFVNFFDKKVNISVPNYGISFGDEDELEDEEKTEIAFLQDLGILAKLEHKILHFPVERSNIRALGYIPERNRLIIDVIEKLVFEGKRVIVFACSKEHAKLLSQILKIKKINVGLILTETSIDQRTQYITKFRETEDLKVLINLEVLTTGFDAPEVDAIIITKPLNSDIERSQILGRVLRGRKNGGHDKNLVIRITDPSFLDEHDSYKSFEKYWRQ